MKQLLFALMAATLVATAGFVYVEHRKPQGEVVSADLAHQHFRATMRAEWTSRTEGEKVITEFVDSAFSLALRPACGLDDGPVSKCTSFTPNRNTIAQSPTCQPPVENRCYAGLGTLVIETEPGFVDDPKTMARGPRTLYYAAHYCCEASLAPWAWLAPDGSTTITSESDFIPLYGTYIVTFFPYHTEWKKSAWGQHWNWGSSGPPHVHKIRVVPDSED
jgi:hypothetical protein